MKSALDMLIEELETGTWGGLWRISIPAGLEATKRQHVVETTCWHCGGSGKCDCSTCGVMKASVVWAAGECVACKAAKSRIQ